MSSHCMIMLNWAWSLSGRSSLVCTVIRRHGCSGLDWKSASRRYSRWLTGCLGCCKGSRSSKGLVLVVSLPLKMEFRIVWLVTLWMIDRILVMAIRPIKGSVSAFWSCSMQACNTDLLALFLCFHASNATLITMARASEISVSDVALRRQAHIAIWFISSRS